ncbi:hypothetical protein [Coleofasciculus sp. FACHB-542]|nr:hypothetical protein [Coleofasciculus sp. FACHB-542]
MSQIKIDKLTSQEALIPVYRETWKARSRFPPNQSTEKKPQKW